METKNERREKKRRKRGKHGHKVDGRGAFVSQAQILKRAEEAKRKQEECAR